MIESIIHLIKEYPVESVTAAALSPKLLKLAFYNAKEMARICLASRKFVQDIFLIEGQYPREEDSYPTIEYLINQSKPKIKQRELFSKETHQTKPKTEKTKTEKQSNLFKNQKSENQPESEEKESSSLVEYIGKDKKNGETGVVLVSNSDISIEKENHDYILMTKRLRRELMEMYRLERLRIYIILSATKADLASALNNPDIQHIAVNGHGNWSEWIDSDGERVSNDNAYVFEERGLQTKSFIRHTCGKPSEDDQFKDQLGAPFSALVFGRAAKSDFEDALLEPLYQTTQEEFLSQKKKTDRQRSFEGMLMQMEERHFQQRISLLKRAVKRILPD